MKENFMEIEFKALNENIKFARAVISAFCLNLDPSISELNDIKTVVSEAVTNAIVHGYAKDAKRIVSLKASICSDMLEIVVCDEGVGISDIEKAQEPFFTTLPEEEHSGMGFTIMQTFMDEFKVESKKGEGTKVIMRKKFEKMKSIIAEA